MYVMPFLFVFYAYATPEELMYPLFIPISNRKSLELYNRKKTIDNALLHSNSHAMEEKYDGSCSDNGLVFGSLSRYHTSTRRCSPMAVSAKDSSNCIDQSKDESHVTLAKTSSQGTEFSRVNCIVWVLHESSRSVSLEVESLRLAASGPELTMAWLGKDVHEWHRQLAYQVEAVMHNIFCY